MFNGQSKLQDRMYWNDRIYFLKDTHMWTGNGTQSQKQLEGSIGFWEGMWEFRRNKQGGEQRATFIFLFYEFL